MDTANFGQGSHFSKKCISLIPAVSQQKVKTLSFRKEMPQCPQPGLGARATSGLRLRGPPHNLLRGGRDSGGQRVRGLGAGAGRSHQGRALWNFRPVPEAAGALVQSQALPPPPATASAWIQAVYLVV